MSDDDPTRRGGNKRVAGARPDRPTPREQHLRNEVGQLTHKVHQMIAQRREMQDDLIRQREDMKVALGLLEMGTIRDAMQVLRDTLAHREQTRGKRGAKSDG